MTSDPLTRREQEIVSLLRTGSSNLQIANALGISVATVETHVKHIRRKLEVRSRQWLNQYQASHHEIPILGIEIQDSK